MTALSENGAAWSLRVPVADEPAARPDLVVDDRPTLDSSSDEPGPAPTRAQLRREAEAAARAQRSRRSLWRAWWLYPLVAGAAVCVWFGVQSASAPAPQEPVVVSVPGG